MDFDENDYVVAGTGARDGIRKCFGPATRGIEVDIIAYMTENQHGHFDHLGLGFTRLTGGPYTASIVRTCSARSTNTPRVAHPEIAGISGRMRIKQHYRPDPASLPAAELSVKTGFTLVEPSRKAKELLYGLEVLKDGLSPRVVRSPRISGTTSKMLP